LELLEDFRILFKSLRIRLVDNCRQKNEVVDEA
jgi:hypothetical protein